MLLNNRKNITFNLRNQWDNGNLVNSANSVSQISHWSMNLSQSKDLVSHMCLAGAVVASWSLTQDAAGSNPFTVMTIQ